MTSMMLKIVSTCKIFNSSPAVSVTGKDRGGALPTKMVLDEQSIGFVIQMQGLLY